MKRKIVIVGAGEVGSYVACLLQGWGCTPVLVEQRPHTDPVPGVVTITGDGTDPGVLESAGIRGADILAAVTGSDEVNLTVACLGRFEFGVGRTLARVNVPRNAWLFTPELGVDLALNQAEVLGRLILAEASAPEISDTLP